MITPSQYDSLAQKAHFLGGLAAVLLSQVLFGTYKYGAAAVVVFALVKEFWYDYKYEMPEIRGSSLDDFMFYLLGAAVGIIITGV